MSFTLYHRYLKFGFHGESAKLLVRCYVCMYEREFLSLFLFLLLGGKKGGASFLNQKRGGFFSN